MYWNQFINWAKHHKSIGIGILCVCLLIVGGVLGINIFNPFVPTTSQNNISDDDETASKQIIITSPQIYEVFTPQDILRLELTQPELDSIDIVLVQSDFLCNQEVNCIKELKPSLREYQLGRYALQRGYQEFNLQEYQDGQYRIDLYQNSIQVGQSSEFAISTVSNQLTTTFPGEYDVMTQQKNEIRWQSSSDIFFVNIYVESDTERFVVAQNYRNKNIFVWDFTDKNGRVISDGEYVLIVENSLSSKKLHSVRFKISK